MRKRFRNYEDKHAHQQAKAYMASSAIHAAQDQGGEEDWHALFSHFRAFDEQRSAQQQSGVNDYSLLASLLKVNDEVRLHSRFLFSLLDPEGSHYQKSLFGERFLSQIGYAGWLDWGRTKAHREHKSVDLYLGDGIRHVIIENKLNASDQPSQLQRYIETIHSHAEADPDDVVFVYLTKGRNTPDEKSLGHCRIVSDPLYGPVIVNGEGKRLARYVNMHYGRHILPWIDDCLQAVADIDNLRYALLEYKIIVERVTRTYQSRVMNLETFLSDSSDDLSREARIRYACRIADELPAIKAGWLTDMFTDGLDLMLEPYVRARQLVPITGSCSEWLKPFQFAPVHARDFFDAAQGRSGRNKGRFWCLGTGPHANQQALAVFFGKWMLHIGVLSITVDDQKNVKSRQPESGEKSFSLAVNGTNLVFEQHAAINRTLSGLVSSMYPLHKDIEPLARFDSSQHKATIEALLRKLLAE